MAGPWKLGQRNCRCLHSVINQNYWAHHFCWYPAQPCWPTVPHLVVVLRFHCRWGSLFSTGRDEKNSEITQGNDLVYTNWNEIWESFFEAQQVKWIIPTFGSSLILFASRNNSSNERVYRITSSGTDWRLQCLRSIHSTWRLHALKIGIHLNIALIIH